MKDERASINDTRMKLLCTDFPCVQKQFPMQRRKASYNTSASSEVSYSQSMHEKERQVEPTFF